METGSKRGNTESMRVVFNNIIRSVKGHPKENFTILINMVLCTMTVFVLLQNYYFLKNHFDLIYSDDQIASHFAIRMSDEDFQSMLSDVLNHSPMYYVGQKVNAEIEENPHLSLYFADGSRIGLNAFADKEQMRKHALLDEGTLEYYQMEGEPFDKDDCYYVETMPCTKNIDKVFNLKLLKGRFFEEDDRNTNDPDIPIPVVLGNDYADEFDIGDHIELDGDRAVVIGILEDNMYISSWGYIEYLDSKILTLCPLIPRPFELSTDDYKYQKMLILSNVYCDDQAVDVQKEINRITAENGYYTYEVQPVDGVEVSETKDVSAKNVALIGLLALIACIICTCSLSSVLYNRTVQDRSVFCIYMCSGIPLWKINLSIIIEMAVFLGVSFFPTYALSIMEYKKLLIPAWQILMFSGIIVLVSLIPVFKINRENNLDMLIRDRIV